MTPRTRGPDRALEVAARTAATRISAWLLSPQVQLREGVHAGAVAGAMDGQQPHWRYYFRVPSISNAKETAETKGGRIAMGPMQVPGGDYIVIGVDPQGAEFALVGGE